MCGGNDNGLGATCHGFSALNTGLQPPTGPLIASVEVHPDPPSSDAFPDPAKIEKKPEAKPSGDGEDAAGSRGDFKPSPGSSGGGNNSSGGVAHGVGAIGACSGETVRKLVPAEAPSVAGPGYTTGKWLWEWRVVSCGNGAGVGVCGSDVAAVSAAGVPLQGGGGGGKHRADLWIYRSDGRLSHGGESAGRVCPGGGFGSGDIVGVELDADAGTLAFLKNDSYVGGQFKIIRRSDAVKDDDCDGDGKDDGKGDGQGEGKSDGQGEGEGEIDGKDDCEGRGLYPCVSLSGSGDAVVLLGLKEGPGAITYRPPPSGGESGGAGNSDLPQSGEGIAAAISAAVATATAAAETRAAAAAAMVGGGDATALAAAEAAAAAESAVAVRPDNEDQATGAAVVLSAADAEEAAAMAAALAAVAAAEAAEAAAAAEVAEAAAIVEANEFRQAAGGGGGGGNGGGGSSGSDDSTDSAESAGGGGGEEGDGASDGAPDSAGVAAAAATAAPEPPAAAAAEAEAEAEAATAAAEAATAAAEAAAEPASSGGEADDESPPTSEGKAATVAVAATVDAASTSLPVPPIYPSHFHGEFVRGLKHGPGVLKLSGKGGLWRGAWFQGVQHGVHLLVEPPAKKGQSEEDGTPTAWVFDRGEKVCVYVLCLFWFGGLVCFWFGLLFCFVLFFVIVCFLVCFLYMFVYESMFVFRFSFFVGVVFIFFLQFFGGVLVLDAAVIP